MTTSLLTDLERHRGAPIRDLTDAAAFRALGASARLRDAAAECSDEEVASWALGATVARVADAATPDDRARIAAWVREGAGL